MCIHYFHQIKNIQIIALNFIGGTSITSSVRAGEDTAHSVKHWLYYLQQPLNHRLWQFFWHILSIEMLLLELYLSLSTLLNYKWTFEMVFNLPVCVSRITLEGGDWHVVCFIQRMCMSEQSQAHKKTSPESHQHTEMPQTQITVYWQYVNILSSY